VSPGEEEKEGYGDKDLLQKRKALSHRAYAWNERLKG